MISDLICGPPPTKPTTTQRTTTRLPTPFPKIVNAIQATPKSEVRLGSRQNLPRRRSGVVGSTNDNSFINNARRIPDKIQQPTFNSGTAKPVKKFNNNPGMTSISCTFTDYNISIKLKIIIHRYIIVLIIIPWNILGDIVTEIKMTVGQGGAKEKLESGRDIIRVPPPVDISSAPSHALAGMV